MEKSEKTLDEHSGMVHTRRNSLFYLHDVHAPPGYRQCRPSCGLTEHTHDTTLAQMAQNDASLQEIMKSVNYGGGSDGAACGKAVVKGVMAAIMAV